MDDTDTTYDVFKNNVQHESIPSMWLVLFISIITIVNLNDNFEYNF